MIKTIATVTVVISFIYIALFQMETLRTETKLWEEYQASVPGCTAPKLEHLIDGADCVGSRHIDADMWYKPASGRPTDQIKAKRDEVNRENGVCHIGDWSVYNGVVHNSSVYYPCTYKAALAIFPGT